MTHIKPTKEELDAKIQEALELPEEELSKEHDTEEPNVEEIEKEAGVKETPKEEPIKEPEPIEAEPSKEVKEALKKEVEEKKQKLSASAKENQKIYAKNRVLNKALDEADELPEPTEEDLQKEFTDWDVMSDTERTFAKETVISRNWRGKIKEAKDQASKIEKWNDEVEKYADDPQTLLDNPELEGKQEDFVKFAQEETNNSVPYKILVSAFLHEYSSAKKENKGAMFISGSGGPNDKLEPKSDKISLDESRKIRETDYNKYKELLMAGKIELDV